jgi:hypothetical protein
MGTQRVHMKGVLPCLVRWACRAGTRDFCSALAHLVDRVQNICFCYKVCVSVSLLCVMFVMGGRGDEENRKNLGD